MKADGSIPEGGFSHVDARQERLGQLAGFMSVAARAMDIAREIVYEHRPPVVRLKGDRDMVSETDAEIERAVRDYLRAQTPEIGFKGEEEGSAASGEVGLCWVLDPIDGTANFVKGIPLYSVSLALVSEGEPVLGIIDMPADGSRYSAVRGHGAFCGDTRIRVRRTEELRAATVTLGDYAVGEHAVKTNQHRLAVTSQLAVRALRVRMLGSAAIDLAWMAQGRTDAAIIFGGQDWDVAAGVVLVREAGGIVIDEIGSRHNLGSAITIAASPQLAGQVLGVIPRSADWPDG